LIAGSPNSLEEESMGKTTNKVAPEVRERAVHSLYLADHRVEVAVLAKGGDDRLVLDAQHLRTGIFGGTGRFCPSLPTVF
jgi:hypothetical protein